MNKTREQLIKDFKKANAARKLKMALKNGFKTSEEYLNSLLKKSKTKVKVSKKTNNKLDYVVAFDSTGSMNAYINDVKKHVENLIPELF